MSLAPTAAGSLALRPMIGLVMATALVSLKNIAYAWSVASFVFAGKALKKEYTDDAPRHVGRHHDPGDFNGVDWLIGKLHEKAMESVDALPKEARISVRGIAILGGAGAALVLRVLFTAPAAIFVGTVVQFVAGSSSQRTLTAILGVGLAVCAMFVLIAAVLRRLIIGKNDWKTSDVQIPKVPPFDSWAANREPGGNLSVYFVVLVVLSVLGFAGLYYGIEIAEPTAFAAASTASPVKALFSSATTLSTLGDPRPLTDPARIAVLCQIATGPLLLSWLLSVFFGGAPSVKQDRGTA